LAANTHLPPGATATWHGPEPRDGTWLSSFNRPFTGSMAKALMVARLSSLAA
jgi:hypothetical protein